MKTFKKLAVTAALTTTLMGASTVALAAQAPVANPQQHNGISALLMLITAHEVQPTVYGAYDLGIRKLQEARQVFVDHGTFIGGDGALSHVQENIKYKVGAVGKAGEYLSVWVKIKDNSSNPDDTRGSLIKLTMNAKDVSDASDFTCLTNLDKQIGQDIKDSTMAAATGSPSVLLPACLYGSVDEPTDF